MAKRTCITCGVKKVDKDKTPLWSKKDGLYSMLPRILNCEDKYNPHKTELEETSPEIVCTQLTVELEIEEYEPEMVLPETGKDKMLYKSYKPMETLYEMSEGD